MMGFRSASVCYTRESSQLSRSWRARRGKDSTPAIPTSSSSDDPKMIALIRPKREFDVGQLVCHRKYGYRGVVVAFDLSCQAPENWYRANQTQPDKQQPWYHVLVDQSEAVTYAAQTSLTIDERLEAIQHPLVDTYFDDFAEGRYVRNQLPWPGH